MLDTAITSPALAALAARHRFYTSLQSAIDNPATHWSVPIATPEGMHPLKIDNIHILFPYGVLSLGVPFLYRVNAQWGCEVASLAYVFPELLQGIPVTDIFDAGDKRIPVRRTSIVQSSAGESLLYGRTFENPYDAVRTLRIYHTELQHVTLSGDLDTTPLTEGRHRLLDAPVRCVLSDDDGAVLSAGILRWWCAADEAQSGRNPHNPYVNIAHRMLLPGTFMHNPNMALREAIAPLFGVPADDPKYSPMFDTLAQRIELHPQQTKTLLNRLVAHVDVMLAQKGERKAGRPRKAPSAAMRDSQGGAVVPWTVAPKEY